MNAAQAAPKNVLVCEDDPVQLRIYTAMLEQAGYRSLPARSPAEALSVARRSVVDAVLTDVLLGEGSGFDVVGDLRRMGLDAPVIMATAYATEGMKVRARAAGVRRFLEKPLSLRQVQRNVDQALRASPRLRPHLLAVDGRDAVRGGIGAAAERAGYSVFAVNTPSAALAVLGRSAAPIEVMVVTLHPAGTPGETLIRQALAVRPNLYVVVVEGEADREEIRRSYAAGADALVRPPVSPERLESILRRCLPAAKAKQRMVERRRREDERRAVEPWTRKLVRRIKRSGSGLLLAVAAASLLIGIALAWTLSWGYEALDRFQPLVGAVSAPSPLRGVASPEGRAFSPWEVMERLGPIRQESDTLRRFYEARFRDLRGSGASRKAAFDFDASDLVGAARFAPPGDGVPRR